MIDAFVEAVRSLVQLCQLVILFPLALTVLAARARWSGVLGAVGGLVVGGWLFVTNRFGSITETELRLSAALVAVISLLLGFEDLTDRERPSWWPRIADWVRSPGGTAALCGLVAMIVTQWWRPCVGVQLGKILTEAPGDPLGALAPSTAYFLGLSLPLVAIGLLAVAAAPGSGVGRTVARVAAVANVALAGAVIAGQHDAIVSRLFQWSQ